MKKSMKNYVVFVAMFILGLAEAVSGFVLWLAFPDGGGGGGRWGGSGLADLTFWGLSKHAWIDVHDWVAVALVVLVLLHVVLHWKWLVRMAVALFKGKPKRLDAVPVKND